MAKEKEKETLQTIWAELPTQGKLFKQFPQQVQILTKLVQKWSSQRTEGKAWIFFIFAVCDWLPTNDRINKHSNEQKTTCNLCQSNSKENTEHLFTCPALISEQNSPQRASRYSVQTMVNPILLPWSTTRVQYQTTLDDHAPKQIIYKRTKKPNSLWRKNLSAHTRLLACKQT